MTVSAKKTNEREAILQTMASPPPGGFFEWDGKDENDRPAIKKEMRAGIEATRCGRRRRADSSKEQVTIRFDTDVLATLRANPRKRSHKRLAQDTSARSKKSVAGHIDS